jgi:hypothetical protein
MGCSEALKGIIETLGAPSPGRSSAAWTGYSSPLGGAQSLSNPNTDFSQPWPYRTQSAEALWLVVKDLIPKHPELDVLGLLRRGLESSGIDPLDLSAEDWRLLEMAVEWRKNGLTGLPKPRIGGAPGGPFDSREYGRTLAKRRAP